MITRELEAFVITARTGSFQKASDQLFISSTALIKQINSLEQETGLTLFRRTNRGLYLTEPGKVFLDSVIDILHRYHQALQSAHQCAERCGIPIRVGFSQINPYQEVFSSAAYGVAPFSDFTLHMVPLSPEYKDFIDELRSLGTNADVIPYFCGHPGLDVLCNTFCLARLPVCVAVPHSHPLFTRERLTYGDLNDQDIISLSGDANIYYKQFNEDILSHAPKARLHPANYFDFSVLNYAASYNRLVIVGNYLKNVHPLLKLIPVEWDHYIPYGLHYSKHPSDAVKAFLQAFRDSGISGDPQTAPIVEF